MNQMGKYQILNQSQQNTTAWKKSQEKEVLKLLQDLNVNKSPGPDGLHPKMLKEQSEALVKPLTIIYSTSLSLGTVPDSWKEGNIIALFKKGDKLDWSA